MFYNCKSKYGSESVTQPLLGNRWHDETFSTAISMCQTELTGRCHCRPAAEQWEWLEEQWSALNQSHSWNGQTSTTGPGTGQLELVKAAHYWQSPVSVRYFELRKQKLVLGEHFPWINVNECFECFVKCLLVFKGICSLSLSTVIIHIFLT